MFDNPRRRLFEVDDAGESDAGGASFGLADALRDLRWRLRQHHFAHLAGGGLRPRRLALDQRAGQRAGNETHMIASGTQHRDFIVK